MSGENLMASSYGGSQAFFDKIGCSTSKKLKNQETENINIEYKT